MTSKIFATKSGVVAGCRVGSLWIGAIGTRPVDDASWSEYIGIQEQAVATVGPHAAVLQWAPEHGPNARQRAMLDARSKELRLSELRRIALLTDSVLIRGVLTAFSWMSPSIKMNAYSRHDAGAALEWLAQVARFDRAEADRQLTELVRVVTQVPAMAAGAR